MHHVWHRRRLIPDDVPLVAIGGIDLERAPDVLRAGAQGIAVIGAIAKAERLDEAVDAWLGLWAAPGTRAPRATDHAAR